MLAQISTGLVQLHPRYYGRGPTKAKTRIVDDTVVCILRGGFTTVERTLLGTGEVESVYMSSIHANPELAVEVFVLEENHGPQPEAPAPPADPALERRGPKALGRRSRGGPREPPVDR